MTQRMCHSGVMNAQAFMEQTSLLQTQHTLLSPRTISPSPLPADQTDRFPMLDDMLGSWLDGLKAEMEEVLLHIVTTATSPFHKSYDFA